MHHPNAIKALVNLKALFVELNQNSLVTSVEHILERARAQSRDLGFDPLQVYEPWLPTDVCQQGIMALHGLAGDSAFAVIAAALLFRAATWPLNARAFSMSAHGSNKGNTSAVEIDSWEALCFWHVLCVLALCSIFSVVCQLIALFGRLMGLIGC